MEKKPKASVLLTKSAECMRKYLKFNQMPKSDFSLKLDLRSLLKMLRESSSINDYSIRIGYSI